MDFTHHFLVLIVATPLIAAVINPVIAAWKKQLSPYLATLALLTSLTLLFILAPRVLAAGWISYIPGAWNVPYGIEIKVDLIGLFIMVIIAGVSLAAVVYSSRYISHELAPEKVTGYYSLMLLLTGAMLGFTATGDIFNMFVFIEIISITSYALVAISGTAESVRASFKYLLMGAPSSILILLAIAFLYSVTGTLNMADLTVKIAASNYAGILIVAYSIFVIGFAVKAALFPLHFWLPDAHSIAPSPVSAMLSGLVVKTGIFGIIRLTYTVYTNNFSDQINAVAGMLPFIGAAAIIYGSVMALQQRDFKRMVAYSTIGHVGYILCGVGLGNRAALVGSIFHILDHSLAKACFFLVAGAIIYQTGYRQIDELKGAGRKMPAICAAFTLAAFSIIGIPPSAGFISKWYIITGSLDTGNFLVATAVLAGSVLAAGYCLRIVYYMFFLPPDAGYREKVPGGTPLSMLLPIWILAAATILFGIFANLVLPLIDNAVVALLKI